MFRTFFLLVSLALSVSAACVDGKDNVITIGDGGQGKNPIQLSNVVGQTYNGKKQPACASGFAELAFPGTLKLVSGQITVKSNTNLLNGGKALLTVTKNSILIGTLCKNGKAVSSLLKDSECTVDLVALLGKPFVTMMDTPGTYDLATIEKMANMTSNVIPFGNLPASINTIVKGEWTVFITAVNGAGQTAAQLIVPGNAKWVYVS